jgi:hypothetical protein
MTDSLSGKPRLVSEKLSIAAAGKLTRRSRMRGIVVREEKHPMSHSTQEHQNVEKQRIRKKWRWIIAAIALLVLGAVLIINSGWSPIPDVGGGLIIDADPDTRIYVGDKLVGTTSVAFSWRELFGDERHSGIAVELSDPTPAITAEMLSGPGATKLSEPSGMGIVGTGNVQITQQSAYLTRRADGALDAVFALKLVWSPPNRSSGNYLLPVRLRKGPVPSTIYFDSAGSATTAVLPSRIMRIMGRSANETKTKCSFTAKSLPPQFAEEIRTKGLWEPGGEK